MNDMLLVDKAKLNELIEASGKIIIDVEDSKAVDSGVRLQNAREAISTVLVGNIVKTIMDSFEDGVCPACGQRVVILQDHKPRCSIRKMIEKPRGKS